MSLTPAERKERVSGLLKIVDREVKAGHLLQARKIIEEVFSIDPANVYARAYSERIDELMEERTMTDMVEHRPPEASAEVPQQLPILPQIPVPAPVTRRPLSAAVAEAYQGLLEELWRDGIVTEDEQERIGEMCRMFRITPEQHAVIEQQVRMDAFLMVMKEKIASGLKRCDHCRAQYRITSEEFAALLPRLQSMSRSVNDHLFVLTIDDDEKFLLFAKTLLEKKGFNCITADSCSKAFGLLETVFPDIVLCDLSLNDGQMDGFMFYEKFRALPKFTHVPFIMITGTSNDAVVIKARQMGVDDLITKPVDREMLLASIEGRLRRIHEHRIMTEL